MNAVAPLIRLASEPDLPVSLMAEQLKICHQGRTEGIGIV